jgi:hypothetical protein
MGISVARDLQALAQFLGADPLAEYMKMKGFDPEKGGRLLVPYETNWGPYELPAYVYRSHLLPENTWWLVLWPSWLPKEPIT